MKNLLLSALLLAALPALAQEPQADTQNARPAAPKGVVAANGRITGTVLCGETRKPARGALVLLIGLPMAADSDAKGQNKTTRVGLDGTFAFEHLLPGEYAVLGVLPGYLTPFDDVAAGDIDGPLDRQREILGKQGTAVVHGSETETLNVTLTRGAAISGRVLYSDGSPATQVSIAVENIAKKPTPGDSEDTLNVGRIMRSVMTQQSFSTDDLGRFRLAGLQSGTYRVAAIQSFAGSGAFGPAKFDMMYGALNDSAALRFYSGDTTHRKAATAYDLRAGDEVTGIDIIIPEHAFHHVSGRLVGAAGRAPNMGIITLTDTLDESLVYMIQIVLDLHSPATPSFETRFDFASVPAGSYTLTVKEAQFDPVFEPKPGPYGKPTAPPVSIHYAPATTSVLVKDADVPDLSLTLTELPPDTKPPQQ